jgi:hypothetical protein
VKPLNGNDAANRRIKKGFGKAKDDNLRSFLKEKFGIKAKHVKTQ